MFICREKITSKTTWLLMENPLFNTTQYPMGTWREKKLISFLDKGRKSNCCKDENNFFPNKKNFLS